MRQGLYEWLVMPFGRCNAPTSFMRLMNDVMCPLLDSFVIIYLDDILVYSSTQEQHMSHLMQVLETLKNHQLLDNLMKYEFAQQSLVYMGYVIGGKELKIDPSKTKAIMKWPVPTNVFEVNIFIGATQYLRKFIASFSLIKTFLHAIIASGKSFQWVRGQKRDFEELNKKITQEPVLITELEVALLSGEECEWVFYGSCLNIGRKECILPF